MKTAKRALSLLLSLMLVLGTVAVGGINAAADESLYEISSYADLKNFADRVNSGNTSACAKLMNDIECKNGDGTAAKDWTPIGKDYDYAYIGTFDGDGHVITGLSNSGVTDAPNYAGLFGYVGTKTEGGVTTKGTVKNVGLKGGKITGRYNVGGVAGYNDGTVTNCYNTGDVTATGETVYVGGVAGYNDGTVANCYNTGNVSGSNYVGGVVGLGNGTVANCYNTGNVSGSKYVGGVVGLGNGTVTNCYNTGDVTATGKTVYASGVVGFIKIDSTITNCYNTGNVTATGDYAYAGGIIGFISNNSTITNCYNTGNVTATGDSAYAGGIIGFISNNSTATNCYNTGSVTATGEVVYVGGVAGFKANEGITTNCYYDSSVSTGIPAIGFGSGTNVKGLTTAQMTGRNAISYDHEDIDIHPMYFNYDDAESPWLTKADEADEASGEYYWFYPQLKGFNLDSDSAQIPADEIETADWPAKTKVSVTWEETDLYTYDGTNQGPVVTSVTVGDTSVPESAAIVTYSEYSGSAWTTEFNAVPTDPGNYKMIIRDTADEVIETRYFTIIKPDTDYTVNYYKLNGASWSFETVSPIDAGDYKAVITFLETEDNSVGYVPDESHPSIEKEFTVYPRAITITAASGELPYDGYAHLNSAVTVTSGELVSGDSLVARATGSVTNVSDNAEGNNPVSGDYKIMRGTEDVTANYVITTVSGTLTITPASVILTANSATETYDGSVKTVEGFTSSVSDLTFDGVTASGSGTNAGSYVVSFSGVTINETTDTTGNYVVTGTVDGILTINPADPGTNAAAQDIDYGQTAVVTFTAPADAKGKVTFTLDEAESGVTKDIENGQAVCEFENLTIGSHKVECVYTGDSNYYSATKETTFTVNSVDCALTINYVYDDGTQAAETYTGSVEIFKDYSVTSPTVTGWTPDIATVEGTMGDEDMDGKTVTVTYTADEYTATFVDENGKTVKAVKFTVETEKLDEPAVPEKAGYAGEWEEYTLGMSDITIKPVYANITSIQIENYEENSETGYKEDKTFTVKADDLPDGAEIHWFVNGEDVGTGESYTVEDPTDDYNIYAEVIDKDGNTLDTTKVQSVKVKNGFFDRLKAFFADLIEKILGKAIADLLSSVC